MSKLLGVSLDVKKITKERLYEGKKGTYLKLTISLNDEIDQFGNNVSVWEEQSKEEREGKVERVFLGNGRIIYDSEGFKQPQQNQQPQTPSAPFENQSDELPF